MALKTVSLFSGCGGSDLGAKQAGADVAFANDNNPYAADTYRRHRRLIASPDVDFRATDIRQIKSFPTCDLLMGCYPCQSFTMGGPRKPSNDPRTLLYQEFLRCLKVVKPKFFIAENVAGMKWLTKGHYFLDQINSFTEAGIGYRVTPAVLNAKDFGVPAERKRVFLVGVRKDLMAWYHFPTPTHGPHGKTQYASHGGAIADLRLNSDSDYYHNGTEEFSWWYMSRNRRSPWSQPSHTIVANGRHVPLHPASPLLRLAESDLKRGFYQRWEFTDDYDVPEGQARLDRPRRLSWQECAVLQTFPRTFRPSGSADAKYLQIGNAVPPRLMRHIVAGLADETSLSDARPDGASGRRIYRRAS